MTKKWPIQRLEQFCVDGVQEDDELEFKRCSELRPLDRKPKSKIIEEISKDVSAFANANGGTIIYGVCERDDGSRRAAGLDSESAFKVSGGDPTPQWISDVIGGNVDPAPPVYVEDVLLDDNSYLIVVEVSPLQHGCQAKDRRYYRRRSTGREAIRDWEVRELLARRAVASVRVSISYAAGNRMHDRHNYLLVVTITNTSQVRIRDWAVEVNVPPGPYQWMNMTMKPAYWRKNLIRLDGNLPIFPSESQEVIGRRDNPAPYSFTHETLEHVERTDGCVICKVYADDMTPWTEIQPMALLTEF